MVEVGQSGVLLPLSGCPKSAQVCFKSTPRGARKFQLTIGPWRARHGPNLVGIFLYIQVNYAIAPLSLPSASERAQGTRGKRRPPCGAH